ncbi:MAG: hypothetical protein AABX35_04340 [Nanoarchaeota archaeon]
MGNDFDEAQDEYYVRLEAERDARLNPRTVDMILRNVQRPSDWPENRLPPHTSTRDGLARAAREFVKTNGDYFFPDADKSEDRKY